MTDSQTTDNTDSGSPPQEGPSEEPAAASGPVNWTRMMNLVSARKIDVALWATRFITLMFAVGYIFPIFGYELLK